MKFDRVVIDVTGDPDWNVIRVVDGDNWNVALQCRDDHRVTIVVIKGNDEQRNVLEGLRHGGDGASDWLESASREGALELESYGVLDNYELNKTEGAILVEEAVLKIR